MFLEHTNQQFQRTGSTGDIQASGGMLYDRPYSRGFAPSEKSLVSTLELLQSYQTVLEADVNLAQLFDLPLNSSVRLEGVESLFRHNLRVLETDQEGCMIRWADVVRSSFYEATPQSDGHYYVRVDKGTVLVSKEDHDFIETGLPQQLVNPHSYPGDVAAEIEIARVTRSQLAPWKVLSSRLSEIIEDVLTGLSRKIEQLQQNCRAVESPLNTQVGPEPIVASEISDGLPNATCKTSKKRRGTWTVEEEQDLPGFFRQNGHMSRKQIENQYFASSGKSRTYSSLQSRLYKLGLGPLSNKKRKPSQETHVSSISLPSTSTRLSSIAQEGGDPGQLAAAIETITRSFSTSNRQSSGTQTVELRSLRDITSTQAPRMGRTPREPDHERHGTDYDLPACLSGKFEKNAATLVNATQDSIDRNTDSSPRALPAPPLSTFEPVDELQEPPSVTWRTGHFDVNSESTTVSKVRSQTVTAKDTRNHVRQTEDKTGIQFTRGRRTADGRRTSPGSDWPHCRGADGAGGRSDLSSKNIIAPEDKGQKGVIVEGVPYPHSCALSASIQASKMDHSLSSPPTTEPPSGKLQLAPQPVSAKKSRGPYRKSKNGCLTCRRKRRKCDEQKPSCSICTRTGNRCEGYQNPGDLRLPAVSSTLQLFRPRERYPDASSPEQPLPGNQNSVLEVVSNTFHSEPSPFLGEMPKPANTTSSVDQGVCGQTSSAISTESRDSASLKIHTTPSAFHPMPQKWTLPSIQEVLKDVDVVINQSAQSKQ